METTPRCPIFDGYRHKGINLLRDTAATWDKMVAAKMQPYDCSNGHITMQPYYFRKAFAGRPATKLINRSVVMYSVWDGHVEISCMAHDEQAPKSEVACPANS